MKTLFTLVGLLLVGCAYGAGQRSHQTAAPTPPPTSPDPVDVRMKRLEDVLQGLSRQVMLQQFYTQETVRGDGDSGLKNMRLTKDGTRNFYETAHVGARSYMAMHDHANYDRTVGLGELNPVMNGVDFRTRHNDYKLRMPSRSTKDYNKYEEIPFPDVPKTVREMTNITDQIHEMREYFRAFKTQNVTHRDYRPYFKPNLCYLEGAWTKATDDIDEPFQSDRHQIDAADWFDLMEKVKPNLCYLEGAWTKATDDIDEPFQSDRHQIDAADWFDLMEKIQFTSYTGSKSVLENFAYLPTSIYKVENGVPLYAQWNYRIMCHPLKNDLSTNMFEPMDDLLYRFPMRRTMDQLKNSRAVRYTLNSYKTGEDHYTTGKSPLDNMMMEIPGKDNYPAVLNDNSFGMVLEDVRYTNHTKVNTGYYHRYFKTLAKGAMGTKNVHRGYNDANLWVAQTTNPKVIDMSVTTCHRVPGPHHPQVCTPYTARYTYALPLEIVYMTPLAKWNPYELHQWQDINMVTAHGLRMGKETVAQAYNGTCSKLFYKTPTEFYSGKVVKDPADTAKPGVGVLDRQGQVRMVASSGTRISTPSIEGIGPVRLRYPIMPVHGEGSGVWKELNALKQMTMHMNRYSNLFEERPGTQIANGTDTTAVLHFQLSTTHQDPPGEHSHDFFLTNEELDEINKGHHLTITTSEDLGHSHVLEVSNYRSGHLRARKCDGLQHCWDGHSVVINKVNT